jgi:glycogen(starch) synthase
VEAGQGSTAARVTESDAKPRFSRGRVVMLVDNGVRNDSRVQKEAAAAAEAGWEVILLGRTTEPKEERWQIGSAQVRLIPMIEVLNRRRYDFHRYWTRPLAYPPNGIAEYYMRRVAAWRADLTARFADLDVRRDRGELTGWRYALRRNLLRVEALAAKVRYLWVRLRNGQLGRARRARRQMSGPWDRFLLWFWLTVLGDRAWRRLEPRLWEFELAFGEVIDRLQPDLIHANDFYMLAVGARATLRARQAGRQVALIWDAHELLSGIKSRSDNLRWLPAHLAYEREYSRYADAVITVSEELAEELQRAHRLPERPTVVLNTPEVHAKSTEPAPSLREICGIGPNTPLLVYSGAAAPQRGLDIMVEALPQIPDVHVVFVVAHPPSKYVESLVNRAMDLGVGHRVHLAPYVPPNQVVEYLSGADAGVIPIHHWPNHEIALITKFFEYAHARLPMVVSDVRAMSRATREIGQGEVFRAGDLEDYIRAVKMVLADPARYRSAYDRPGLLDSWTWRSQAKILDSVYSRFAPARPRRIPGEVPDVSVVLAVRNDMPRLEETMRSLLRQTMGEDCFEVISVDTGSTDGSGERMDRYARRHSGVRSIRHARLSGAPAAPYNVALDVARGRYVLFVRPGDTLAPDTLEQLVTAADDSGRDVVRGSADLASTPPVLFRRRALQDRGLRLTESPEVDRETAIRQLEERLSEPTVAAEPAAQS